MQFCRKIEAFETKVEEMKGTCFRNDQDKVIRVSRRAGKNAGRETAKVRWISYDDSEKRSNYPADKGRKKPHSSVSVSHPLST